MNETWVGLLFAGIVAFMLGHISDRRNRFMALISLVCAPIAFVTIALAFAPPNPPSFLAQWHEAMTMIAPYVVIWVGLTAVGYLAARWSLR